MRGGWAGEDWRGELCRVEGTRGAGLFDAVSRSLWRV